MTTIEWDPKAQEFLRKLPKQTAERIFHKVDTEVRQNPERHLETLIGIEGHKIRIGEYRLFVDYKENNLIIRTIRHRKNAYKK